MKKIAVTGFTIIELMVTLSIAAILMGIAIPNFISMIKNNRLSTQTNDLIADLSVARGESAKRGVRVTMCISTDGATCTGTNWALGRIVFSDGGTAGTVDGTDTIIRVMSALRGTSTLTSATFTNNTYVQFISTGESDSTGTFKLCDDRIGNFGKVITISTTGRVSTATGQACP